MLVYKAAVAAAVAATQPLKQRSSSRTGSASRTLQHLRPVSGRRQQHVQQLQRQRLRAQALLATGCSARLAHGGGGVWCG